MQTLRTALFAMLFASTALISFGVSVNFASAQPAADCSNPDNCLQNPLGNTSTLDELLVAVLDAIIAIGVVVITIMIVYVGFLFVVAQGNEEKIRSARSALMWTVIGAVILLGARVIAGVISSTVDAL